MGWDAILTLCVMAGAVVEMLYRAIRPLRIYEGTSEIQRTLIGRAMAAAAVTKSTTKSAIGSNPKE